MTAPVADTAMAEADADLQPSEAPTEPETSPAPAEASSTVSVEGDTPPSAETPPASEDQPEPPADPGSTAPDEAPDLSGYPAFTYRSAGGEHEYPGTHADEDGNVLFTKPAVERLKHDLALAKAYPKRDAEAQRSLQSEKSSREAAEAALNEILSTFDQMFENGTWQDWAQSQHENWPKLRMTALQKSFDLRTKSQTEELARLRNAESDREQRPQMQSRVEEAVRHWGKEAGLTEAEQGRILRKWQSDEAMDRLFPRAAQDDPVKGLKSGQRSENLDPLRDHILDLYEVVKSRTTAKAEAADVKKENDKRQGKTATPPPPVARVSSGKPAGTKPKTYKSAREADEDIWA